LDDFCKGGIGGGADGAALGLGGSELDEAESGDDSLSRDCECDGGGGLRAGGTEGLVLSFDGILGWDEPGCFMVNTPRTTIIAQVDTYQS
jgi:hypothetical protein